ncbi:ankyrin repeat and death domain-containing 1B isoform X1 [Pelobates cultripes]|uniref:Ankyrin repeat and death domain-containing 1B isoform X1 n=1 Tax=Pelobates cultripes TaxID=61616 RepID=A0AAD1SFA4_PELCU|nr:ankyrin repeat and death domain-containing 1B isoform X1 [Pelobates cultripes]
MKGILKVKSMVREKVTMAPGWDSEDEEDGSPGNRAQKMLSTVTGMVQTARNRHGPDKNADVSHETLLQKEMEFHVAAKKNDVPTMMSLKDQRININSKNNLNRTALHFAVAGNNLQAVSFLLHHKARVDIVDKHGLCVLHLAAWSADLTIFQMLIKAGADQKTTNEDGMNVLHFAAQNNKNAIVDYLLTELQLQDLDILDKKGRKPFHLAAEAGHLEMINNLLTLKLFTPEKDKEGNTALHLAAKNGHRDVVEILIERYENIDDPNENGATPFYLAVEGCREKRMDPLLMAESDNPTTHVCPQNEKVKQCHEACAELLLTAGSDINTTTHDDYGALHIAAENGCISLVRFLIENNIDMNPKPDDKNPPLHLAILKDHMPIVDVLLESGYNFNAINSRQQTTLHLVAENNNIDLVEKLLKIGCDLTIVDKQGKTALGVAARSNHTLTVDMIIKAERYYMWKQGLKENIQEVHQASSINFKQDHSLKTSQIRDALWSLAYNEFKPHEWKKLAQLWEFTEPQIKAIEEQWTGQASYREHGHRMLLIWLHGILLTERHPVKSLYEDLVQLGHHKLAGNLHVWLLREIVTLCVF